MKKEQFLDILERREQGNCQLYSDQEIIELERMLWDKDDYKQCWLCKHFMNSEQKEIKRIIYN